MAVERKVLPTGTTSKRTTTALYAACASSIVFQCRESFVLKTLSLFSACLHLFREMRCPYFSVPAQI